MSAEMYNEIELDNDVIDALEEQASSKKLSPLSTSHQERQRDLQPSNKIPSYLSNKSECSQKLLDEILSTTKTTGATATADLSSATSHEEEDLRQTALLMHKLISEQLFQSVWVAYFKSGTAQLKMNQTGPSIWPLNVKTMVKQAIDAGTDENDACMKLVQDRLRESHAKIQNYQTELDHLKNHIQGDREAIYQKIERYLQQKLASLRGKVEHNVALVQYDYNDRALELEFLQLHPNDNCVRLHE